ncbi:hypothetical protein GFH48_05765 [Streptomyces fagopyri]|uniref:Uncharacterized protein n=1 Tax=Streptomyces fagopyri TaxID=2662397 RepID=A0A5Q0L705_9ACTN|nr:hypothetical protein [Streptomyces fagopyri]QFZ72840.1 hypothetical protein GFH48_05765 [Streptomyces fagopyri]
MRRRTLLTAAPSGVATGPGPAGTARAAGPVPATGTALTVDPPGPDRNTSGPRTRRAAIGETRVPRAGTASLASQETPGGAAPRALRITGSRLPA